MKLNIYFIPSAKSCQFFLKKTIDFPLEFNINLILNHLSMNQQKQDKCGGYNG